MRCTCWTQYRNITSVHAIGTANNTANLPSSGIMRADMCIYQCQCTSGRFCSASSTPPHKTAKPTAPQHQEDLWGKSAVRKTTLQSLTARLSGEEIHPRSHGSVFIFGLSSWRHHVNPPQRSCLQTSKPDGTNNQKMPPVPWLCSHPRQCNTPLQSKQHDPCHPQQCLLPIRTKSPKPSKWPHVYGRIRQNPDQ